MVVDYISVTSQLDQFYISMSSQQWSEQLIAVLSYTHPVCLSVHSLFPTMPRHNLYKIAPLVKSLCEKHNIPYIVKPLGTAFADIVR